VNVKLLLSLLLSLLLFAPLVAAQGTDAALTGTILDSTGAIVPGATVTALNILTGVSTKIESNTAGAYTFVSLQPGSYRVTVEKTGFKKMIMNEQLLRTADRVTLNLTLEVGVVTESVQVEASQESVNTLTSTQGGNISSSRILDLPVASRNAMDFITTQAGIVSTSYGVNMNGARTDMVNITLDGTNIIDNFINESVGNTMISASVDRIEEVKVVTTPADAEFGRGSGQIMAISRSGNNQYHGSVWDNIHNTKLNANTWANNRAATFVPRTTVVENWPGVRVGGPIKKNKTFFFVLFEDDIYRSSSTVTATTLTDTARKGIYRFFPGAVNTNANGIAGVATVDPQGNPVTPTKATGTLQSVSLFGLDPNRMAPDTTGIVTKNLSLLPSPNTFGAGDGLNTAGYQWRQPLSYDGYSFTVRIDHQFNEKNRLTASYSRDIQLEPNGFDAQPLPTSPQGLYKGDNTVGSMALTSTFGSNIVNEARIGVQRALISFVAPWINDPRGLDILPKINGVPYIMSMGAVTSPLGTSSSEDPQGRISPVYEARDKITWLHGIHSIKAGIDLRYISANSWVAFNVIPRVSLGVASSTPTQNINTISGIGSNNGTANSILAMLAGSVSSQTQQFYTPGGANPQWVPGNQAQHTYRSREWGTFVQDDIKLKSNLTLNLGMRWDYYGVPYEAHGRLAGLVGGSSSIFGISGTDFSSLFHPGVTPGSLTNLQLIGKNSPHPNQQPWNPNYRAFAPAIGLSWSLPYQWMGANKTVLRMGYGIAYERDPLVLMDQLYGFSAPGYGQAVTYAPTTYQNLVNSTLPLGLPTTQPFATVPINDTNSTTQTLLTAGNDLKTPYIQNWNVSLGREIVPSLTLDVRYVGSKGTKLLRGVNINEVNIFENGVLDAFQTTLAGGNSPLLNQVFKGLNFTGAGVVDGVNVTGSDAMRKNSTLYAYLLANNVAGLANFLQFSTNTQGVRGGYLQRAGLPQNFAVANPQFGAADLIGNYSNSTYHSLQIEANKRFSHGLTIQASYVRSKALGEYDGNQQSQVTSFLEIRNQHLDKRLLSFDYPNVWRTNGSYSLPFGPQRKFFGGSHGLVAKLVEKWDVAAIFNKLSGSPTYFSDNAGSTVNTYGGATPQTFGPLPKGTVHAVGKDMLYFTGLTQVTDPSVARLPSSLQSLSALYAIKGPDGQILLQNPALGSLGSLSLSDNYRGLGTFTFNVQANKRVTLNTEHNVTAQFRVDAVQVLNRPQWGTPNLNIDSTSFGLITSAGGNRSVNLTVRVEF
jgi:hypothetical protein